MGLWSSFHAYHEPFTPEAKKLYGFDELHSHFGSIAAMQKAVKSDKINVNIFSAPKHRKLDLMVWESAQRLGGFGWSRAYDDWTDVTYQITAPDLKFLWHNLLFEMGQYGEDAFDDELSQDHLDRFGRCWQLVNHELPAMYKIHDALKNEQVVYYSTSK